jgi:hemerythrin
MSATKHQKAQHQKLTRLFNRAQSALEKSQKAQDALVDSLKALSDAWQEHCSGEGNGEAQAHAPREDAEEASAE